MSIINVDEVLPFQANEVRVGNVPIKGLNNSITLGRNNNPLITIGSFNTGVGVFALKESTGNSNVAVGYNSQKNVTTGFSNTAVGTTSMRDATTCNDNTAVGSGVGTLITTGSYNTLFGSQAGYFMTTGDYNTCIGMNAGGVTTGSRNTVIGVSAEASSPTATNEITLGDANITALRCTQTSITSLSDARDKKDIQELPVGLDFVNTLKPVTFVWNDRDESGKHDVKDFGFIAQDLKKAQEDVDLTDTLKLVYESNPEKLEASYGKLIPILIKAIQDLSKEVDALKNK